jgi:glycopeptide antibiotics resistance protein
MSRVARLWLLWFSLVLFLSLPWMGFTTVPQWERVNWIPFAAPADKLRDVVLNSLLFLPLGFAVGRRRPLIAGVVLSAVMALTISIPAEATQLFSTRRFPSATDVATAALGAMAGAVTTLSVREASKPRTWTD